MGARLYRESEKIGRKNHKTDFCQKKKSPVFCYFLGNLVIFDGEHIPHATFSQFCVAHGVVRFTRTWASAICYMYIDMDIWIWIWNMDRDWGLDKWYLPASNWNENRASNSAQRAESKKHTQNLWGDHFGTNRNAYAGSPFGLPYGKRHRTHRGKSKIRASKDGFGASTTHLGTLRTSKKCVSTRPDIFFRWDLSVSDLLGTLTQLTFLLWGRDSTVRAKKLWKNMKLGFLAENETCATRFFFVSEYFLIPDTMATTTSPRFRPITEKNNNQHRHTIC